jgi:hypothetical protein
MVVPTSLDHDTGILPSPVLINDLPEIIKQTLGRRATMAWIL